MAAAHSTPHLVTVCPLDVIALGELDDTKVKLHELVDATNRTSITATVGRRTPWHPATAQTCHLVTIWVGVLPSNVLVAKANGKCTALVLHRQVKQGKGGGAQPVHRQ